MAPKKEIEVAPPVVAKRGRGRPRNNDIGETSNAGAKRGRGRPQKLGRGNDEGATVAATGNKRSPSPAHSESPIFGDWSNLPISEFILVLYEPIQRVQLLPQAVANALEGEGPFRFLLHRVGARQGP